MVITCSFISLVLLSSMSAVVKAYSTLSMTIAVKKTSPIASLSLPKPNAFISGLKPDVQVLNPIEFGAKVIQSGEGKEATAQLVDGGLGLVGAVLDEGSSSKVQIPGGFDKKSGKPIYRVVKVGPKELADVGLFAAGEAFHVGRRLYVGEDGYRPAPFKLSFPNKKADGVVSPFSFGIRAATSKDGKAALEKLVEGGVKLVKVAFEEGGNVKVTVPTGFTDYRTGKPTFKEVGVGPLELTELGLFTLSELFAVYKKVYYGDAKTQSKQQITFVPERRVGADKRLVSKAKAYYYVNIGGQRVKVNADPARLQ
mmetsp:Transcript_6589/g.14955  ORF Transcript_6589/g.14955 Transcript_6589/m.14955 type:complete len:311 (-) Transcript_6589:56-988(-)